MAIPENILNELKREDRTRYHLRLLEDTKELVEMSRDKMSDYYDSWDRNHDIFRSLVSKDRSDREARERKEPEKMVVPTAFSQILTFAAFCYSLYTQRERIFELIGVSEEDHDAAKIGEALIARDLSENQFEVKLIQFLLDICRFTLGIWEVAWVKETRKVKRVVETGIPIPLLGRFFGRHSEVQEVDATSFLGNRIYNISPYKFFPDVRLPLARFQEGEFVASEDEFSYHQLKQLEYEGVVAGVEHIRALSRDAIRERKSPTRLSFDLPETKAPYGQSVGQSKHPILVTKVQRVIIPSEYEIEDGVPVGKEDYPVKYLVWYANDDRIIRAEKLDYPHGRYTYELAQFIPDQHDLVGMSFSESIDSLQSVISWFINSHIASVRKVIQNFLVVDPSMIEMDDVKSRNPVVRLKPIAGGRGIDRVIKQLDVVDVTARHLDDVKALKDIVQETTGVNDNLLGQFHTGRRSATEARNVSTSTAARLKMLASQIYKSALEPTAKQILENLRVGLDEETIVRVVGLRRAQAGSSFKKVTREDLMGSYDFEIFDGTLPSEKSFVAQALQEVLVALISRPEAAIALQVDPRKMLLEVLELRGVRNPERFTLLSPTGENDGTGQLESPIQGAATPGVSGATGELVLPGGNGGAGTAL